MLISRKFKVFPLLALAGLVTACGGSSSSSSSGNGGAVVVTPPQPSGPQILYDLVYGQGETQSGAMDLKLDIYQPDANCAAARPTILYVHGGSFITGDKLLPPIPILADAALERDFNFVSVNYRLAGDEPVIASEFAPLLALDVPGIDENIKVAAIAATEDITKALRWMEQEAGVNCLDMSRLAYWGSSAGSYVVLQVAYSSNELGIARPEPDVVIDYWGDLVVDTTLEYREAPFLILHGDADDVVSYQHALELAAQADSVDVPYSFYTVTGAGHAYLAIDIFGLTVDGDTLLTKTLNFIEAHLVGGSPLYETVTITP